MVFTSKERRVVVGVVNGDDFTCLGEGGSLDWFKKAMEQEFPIKSMGKVRRGPG